MLLSPFLFAQRQRSPAAVERPPAAGRPAE